ncbi:MAG: 50S ribosomal protein L13 [Methanomassiliicoccales archaeon]|jgi:large subunit ribosomal protein L13|nr:50S ribosomal protein L13 [Methanomassiliicoccales archaeon]
MAVVIDADGNVLGRLCTDVAKKILKGEEVVVVNAEKAIVTGSKEDVFAEYKQKKDRGKVIHGPFYPRRADLILKRTVRGMLPWDKPKGRDAYRLLKVYVGVPKEWEAAEKVKLMGATKLSRDRYVTLSEVSEYLGSKVR